MRLIGALAVLVLLAGGGWFGRWSLSPDDASARPADRPVFRDEGRAGPLVRSDGGPWSFTKLTYADNLIGRARGPQGDGLYAYAVNGPSPVSKASVTYGELDLVAGDAIEVAACVWAPGEADLSDVFLFDLECAGCWPSDARAPNPSPGVRIHLKTPAGYPVVERAKIGLGRASVRPDPADQVGLPRDRWTRLVWRVGLGDEDAGWTGVWLDGRQVLGRAAQTLPRSDAFTEEGVVLARVGYDYLELGVTANGGSAPLTLGFRDISITVLGASAQLSERPGPTDLCAQDE